MTKYEHAQELFKAAERAAKEGDHQLSQSSSLMAITLHLDVIGDILDSIQDNTRGTEIACEALETRR